MIAPVPKINMMRNKRVSYCILCCNLTFNYLFNLTSKIQQIFPGLVDKEKNKVKKQIDDLKKLISDIDFQLEITTYGEYKVIDGFPSQISDSTSKSQFNNIDDILQYELFQMSGIYCVKSEEDEYVFNFSPSSSIKSPYSVQVVTKDQTVQLGSWVMPWGINIDNIVSETPLERPKDIIDFLRNCKRNIDCYAERTKQFDDLKVLLLFHY